MKKTTASKLTRLHGKAPQLLSMLRRSRAMLNRVRFAPGGRLSGELVSDLGDLELDIINLIEEIEADDIVEDSQPPS